MVHLLWADASGERMFIEAALNGPDRPSVEFVADGDELLRSCSQASPDLIVLDLDLPGVSGLDVLAELRHRRNTVPVVVFSRSARAPTSEACYALGAVKVIPKPRDYRDFREGVQQVCAVSGSLAAQMRR